MRFFSTVLFPDASLFSEGWVDPLLTDLCAVGAEGKFYSDFVVKGTQYALDGTARGGRVICSINKAEQIVTHVAVVSGAEPEEDDEILALFLDVTIRSPVIQELTDGVNRPFREVTNHAARPFCATVLTPLETRAENELVLDWQHRWVASHLHAVVEARP